MSTIQQSGLWKVEFGELGATLKSLQDHGVMLDHLARLRAKPDYAKRVAEFILRGGMDGSSHHKLARAIMGKNFWGVEEWAIIFGVNFTKKQLREVTEFPWGEDVLNAPCPFVEGKSVKDTHFAFLGVKAANGEPLTILTLQKLHPTSGQPKFASYAPSSWYSDHDFAKKTTLNFRWYLMLKEIVPNSTSTNFKNQKAMLPAEYEVPLCIEEVSKDLLVFRKVNVYPNGSVYARCSDVSAYGFRLYAGNCDRGGGVGVDGWGDSGGRCGVGVAASRKVPS